MEAIRKVKEVEKVKKFIQIPAGWDTMRERGNIYEHNGVYIFTATCSKEVDGEWQYAVCLWTFVNRDNVVYYGVLAYGSEDPSLIHYADWFHLWVENKDAEREKRTFMLSHYKFKSIENRTLIHVEDYKPEDSGIKDVRLYSPLIVDRDTLISDWSTDETKRHQENIGLTKRGIDGKFGKLQTILLADKYRYASFGVNGSLHSNIDGKFILEVGGLIGYHISWDVDPINVPENIHPKSNWTWVTGLAECDTLMDNWKLLNRKLTYPDGTPVHCTFAKDSQGWFGLVASDKQSVYLVELITKSNGGNMKAPKILNYDKNTRVLTWEYNGEAVDKFDIVAEHNPPHNWIGKADNPNRVFIVPKQYIKGDSQFFKVVAVIGNAKGFSEPFVVTHKEPETPPPPNGENAKLVAEVKDELKKIEVYTLEHLGIAHNILNKIK